MIIYAIKSPLDWDTEDMITYSLCKNEAKKTIEQMCKDAAEDIPDNVFEYIQEINLDNLNLEGILTLQDNGESYGDCCHWFVLNKINLNSLFYFLLDKQIPIKLHLEIA